MATYQAQLSLGLHILVMMGTFFAAGFYGVSYVSPEPLHVRASLTTQLLSTAILSSYTQPMLHLIGTAWVHRGALNGQQEALSADRVA